jgi:preprotein translocase subunit SecY
MTVGFTFGALTINGMTLKEHIWFTIMILIVVRIGTFVPVPGFDPVALDAVFRGHGIGILGVYDLISGGAFGRMSIFALGIMPYITCAILLRLVASVSPRLKTLETAGTVGRKTFHQYARYGTLLLCLFQSYGLAVGFENLTEWSGAAVIEPGLQFRVTTVLTLAAGGMLLLWLSEQINDRGIGNGALLIFAVGVAADFASVLAGMSWLAEGSGLAIIFFVFLTLIAVAASALIVFVERASRRVVVDHKTRPRTVGARRSEHSFLLLKVNGAGVIPAVAAMAILPFFLGFAYLYDRNRQPGETIELTTFSEVHVLSYMVYAGLVGWIAYIWARAAVRPYELAEQLRQEGGHIPGIRPGKNTADYLDYKLKRMTVIGIAYVVLACLLPDITFHKFFVPLPFAGATLVIIVGVTLEFMRWIVSQRKTT